MAGEGAIGVKSPTSLRQLLLLENDFSGQWPEASLRKMVMLFSLVIFNNRFSGSWPMQAIARTGTLAYLNIEQNSLSGTWSVGDMPTMPELWLLSLTRNQFAGTFVNENTAPVLHRLLALRHLQISTNAFSGTWPQQALQRLQNLQTFFIHWNRFSGSWPREALPARPIYLRLLYLALNRFTGSFGVHSYQLLRSLVNLVIDTNHFEGSWPHDFLGRHTPNVARISIARNAFTGTWPAAALSNMPRLTSVIMEANRFFGTWTLEGLNQPSWLTELLITRNRFTGTWSEAELRHTPFLMALLIVENSFTGSWPFDSFGCLPYVQYFAIAMNKFEGSFCGSDMPASLQVLAIYDTNLQGTLPTAVEEVWGLRMLRCGGSWLEGGIPRTLSKKALGLDLVSLGDLHLEGSIPATLSRLRPANASLALGHGLGGPLPALVGTFLVLSAFRNNLEGRWPLLNVAKTSYVVAHSNLFSCKIPPCKNSDCGQSNLALVLLSNYFARPRAYPPWIHDVEKGDFFTVSNRHLQRLLLKVFFGAAALTTLVAVKIRLLRRRHAFSNLRVTAFPQRGRKLDLANAFELSLHSVFADTLAASLLAVGSYMQHRSLACETVESRLQIPVMHLETRTPIALQMLVFCKVTTSMLAVRCRFAHLSHQRAHGSGLSLDHRRARSPMEFPSSAPPLARPSTSEAEMPEFLEDTVFLQRSCRKLGAWVPWLVLCCFVSAPAVAYSLLKTIPGLVHASAWLTLFVSQSVSLVTALITSAVLPQVAAGMHHVARKEELVSMGKFLALPLIPCISTLVFHEECLGLWSQIWRPCLQHPSPLDSLARTLLPYFQGSAANVGVASDDMWYHERLVRRQALCGRRRAPSPRCTSAVLTWGGQFLLDSFVHTTFTTAAVQIILARVAKLGVKCLDLVQLWQLIVVFGPAVPLLLPMSSLNLLVHNLLLFGVDEIISFADHRRDGLEIGIPYRSTSVAATCALVLQFFLAASTFANAGVLLACFVAALVCLSLLSCLVRPRQPMQVIAGKSMTRRRRSSTPQLQRSSLMQQRRRRGSKS